MTRTLRMSFLLLAFALTSGCGKKDDDKANETPKTEPGAAKPAVENQPESKPPEPEAPAAEATKLTKKKLSELDTFAWMDILKAAGWTDAVSGGMTMGAWSQSTITAQRGDKTAKVTIVEPSGKKGDPKASIKAQSPKEQLKGLQEKGAAELLKDDFLLAVTIDGDPEGANKLLAHIKQWIIVE